MTVLDATETADLAFHGDALGVRHLNNFPRDFHVVLKGRRRLAVGHERAVHHDAGKAHLDGGLAGLDAVAVIQVQNDRDLRIDFGGGDHQVIQEPVVRVLARATAGLNNDRRLGFPGCFHNGLDLLQVVDVERANAIPALGCLVEDLSHGD